MSSVLFLMLTFLCAAQAHKPFDPTRDPAQDLAAAEKQAAAEHKNVLIDAGGNWCGWCMVLDKLMHSDAGLHDALEKHFVVVHANWSKDAPNDRFFAAYPKVNGYPYFFVVSPKGKLLTSQPTDSFEADHTLAHGYSVDRLKAFLQQWSPKGEA